jgi:hypothetical protein
MRRQEQQGGHGGCDQTGPHRRPERDPNRARAHNSTGAAALRHDITIELPVNFTRTSEAPILGSFLACEAQASMVESRLASVGDCS